MPVTSDYCEGVFQDAVVVRRTISSRHSFKEFTVLPLSLQANRLCIRGDEREPDSPDQTGSQTMSSNPKTLNSGFYILDIASTATISSLYKPAVIWRYTMSLGRHTYRTHGFRAAPWQDGEPNRGLSQQAGVATR